MILALKFRNGFYYRLDGDAQAASDYADGIIMDANPMKTIGTEEYIGLYNRGFEAWTAWRRTSFPTFNVPAGKTYNDIPVRMPYPVLEQTLNEENWVAASSPIGGDMVNTRLFWNK